MKKLLLLTCMLLCTCLIGWAQDEEPEGAELSITCNSEELTDFEAEGGSQQVKITSNADWSVSGVPEWMIVSPSSGEAGTDIPVTITVNSNVNNEASTEAREATITFTATKGEETKTVTLTIKQKGKEVEPEPLSITCSVEELPEFEVPGGTRQVMITTNASWTVSGVTEWLYINPEKGEAGTNISVSIQVYPNTTTEEREATLTFKATKDGKSETVTLTIKQKGKEVEPEPEPEPVSITCNSEGLPEFEAEGGKQDIKITSNADWTVSGVPDWITVTPDNGNAGTDLSVAITVNSNIDANASTKERNATITFTATKGEETKTVTLTIKQKGKEVEPEPEPVSITCSVEELPEFNAEGGKQEVKITSNGIWNASEFPKWITVTPQTGGEGTDISVEIEVSENTSTEPREATIIFTATKGEETKTITLTIKQKGKEVEPEPVSITCSVEELPEFDAEGGKQEIKITSNGIWNASEFPNWVKVTPQTDGEGTDISVEIEVGENTSTEPRNATISFTATKGEETKTVTLTIKQKGKEVEPEPEPVSITCNSEGLQAFEADGGQQQVKITSNADWTVSGLLEWITVTPSEGKEGTDVLVTIQVNPNTSTEERNATITFTATKDGKSEIATLTIKQKGKEVEPEPESVSITCDAEELPVFEADGGTLPVNITSNADWTVSELPEWITVTPSSGNAGTDIPVEIKVGENTTTEAREATITFTATKGEETKTISLTIKQKGKEVEPEPEPLSITCSVEELPEFEADGGQQQVKITSNADWAVSGLPEWITVTPSEGNAGTDMLVTIQTNPNTEANPREATITFAASKDGQIKSVTLTIKQKTKEVVPESVSITCNSEGLQAFEADGGQQQVKITSNASWSVSGLPEWISMVDPSKGKAGKDILVTIQVSPNISAEPREVTITFTATKDEETKTTTLTIKQKGKEITPAEISYQLKSLDGASIENQTKLDTLSAGSHVLELEIESDDSWHANTTSEWIKVSPNKGQDGKTTVTISIAPNTTKEKRSGTVKFIADSDTEEDYVSQLTIWQAFADTITTYKIKYTSNWDKTQNNVLEGEKIEVSFVLTENGTPISDYSNFTWETPSDDSKQFTITAEYKENGGPQYYQPKLKMNGIPVKVDPFSYTVWPKIQVPADWQMALTDVNRSKAIGKGIRAGNEFKLEKNPIMQGGYQAANNWTYEIKVNNELITPNANKLIIPTKQDSYSAEIVCYAVNLYDGKTEMGRIEIGRVSTTIYPKPTTPTSLELKGNGTSGTWFVNDTKDIYMGYGDGDYHDIAIDTRSDKWFVSTASTSHLNDNPYIYKTKTYSDNVTITSGRRYKDRTDEAWDGSTYEGETRGYSDSTDITGPFATTGASGSYNINGVKTATMTRGLNIIRMEDGTVKKVFKK